MLSLTGPGHTSDFREGSNLRFKSEKGEVGGVGMGPAARRRRRPKRRPEVQISLFPDPRQRLFPKGNGLLRLTRDLCFGGCELQIGGTRNQGAGRTLSRCNRLGRHGGTFAT